MIQKNNDLLNENFKNILCVVNGAWGMWSPLGRCIRRNNLCTRTRTRECDNPPPSGGGTICIGKKIHSVNCNANDCGKNSYFI